MTKAMRRNLRLHTGQWLPLQTSITYPILVGRLWAAATGAAVSGETELFFGVDKTRLARIKSMCFPSGHVRKRMPI